MKELSQMSARELEEFVEQGTGIAVPARGGSSRAWSEWYVATVLMIFAQASRSEAEAIEKARAHLGGAHLEILDRCVAAVPRAQG